MGYLDRVASSTVTRRSFVAATAATAALAAAGLSGCNQEEVEPTQPVVHTSDERDLVTGEWKLAACWHNCGGRCCNKALVRDGVIIRQKTDTDETDTFDSYQQRACVRGHSQRMQTMGADRLRYPMKRKHWMPGGNGLECAWLRGRDEWERISWDQALTYIMDEAKRIYETYGDECVYSENGQTGQAVTGTYFHKRYNGWGTSSYGAWYRTYNLIGMDLSNNANDRYDWKNCEYIVFMGANPCWTSGGSIAWMGYQGIVVRGGGKIKLYFVDPMYSETCSLFDGTWVPCRPSTDIALQLALAYELYQLDVANGKGSYIDWDFLERCTIGFDADHMPVHANGKDVNPADNFLDYLLGTYDGVAKSAEWATAICGTPVAQIKELAAVLSCKNKVAIITGWSTARTRNAESLPQMVMTLGAMGGHFGKSGHMCGVDCSSRQFTGAAASFSGKVGSAGIKSAPSAGTTTSIAQICKAEMWDCLNKGEFTYSQNITDPRVGQKFPVDIKMMVFDSGAGTQTSDGQANYVKFAREKAEFIVAHGQFETTNCHFADIVLPITTKWEEDGGGSSSGGYEAIFPYQKVVEPKYETMSEVNIGWLYAKKRGADCSAQGSVTNEQGWYNVVAGAMYRDPSDNVQKTLVTLTDADLTKLGVSGYGKTQQGIVSYDEFMEKGCIVTKRSEGDRYSQYIRDEAFRADPEGNPKTTESGKMEIYCQRLADRISAVGYSVVPPIPQYNPPAEGVEATYANFEQGVKGQYPFQMYNPHYWRRSHTVFDNILWMREAWPNPFIVNAQDAEAKGVKNGDVILVESPHGKSMRHACVTNRIMPGVVAVPHGAWLDLDEATGIDKSGSDNYLCGNVPTGQGISGWNSQICDWSKYDVELVADCDKPQRLHTFE